MPDSNQREYLNGEREQHKLRVQRIQCHVLERDDTQPAKEVDERTDKKHGRLRCEQFTPAQHQLCCDSNRWSSSCQSNILLELTLQHRWRQIEEFGISRSLQQFLWPHDAKVDVRRCFLG